MVQIIMFIQVSVLPFGLELRLAYYALPLGQSASFVSSREMKAAEPRAFCTVGIFTVAILDSSKRGAEVGKAV